MLEKEKMKKGLLYDANEEELIKDRNKAKNICYIFNQTNPMEEKNKRNY